MLLVKPHRDQNSQAYKEDDKGLAGPVLASIQTDNSSSETATINDGAVDDSSAATGSKFTDDSSVPPKPRYTARLDHQFPISTVAVLADP